MNTKLLSSSLLATTTRRSLGLGLAALTAFGTLACDTETEEDLRDLEEAYAGEESGDVEPADGEDLELVAEADAQSHAVISASQYGTALQLTERPHTSTHKMIEVRDPDYNLLASLAVAIDGGAVFWTGTNGDDALYAATLETPIIAQGLGGNDTISGGYGDDFIDGGDGNDSLNGRWGKDTLVGGAGQDVIFGGEHADTIEGGSGADDITAGSGHDFVTGGMGNDILRGGPGDDILQGGQGSDDVRGGSDDDLLFGHVIDDGNDGDDDTLDGGSEDTDIAIAHGGDTYVDAAAPNAPFYASRLFCHLFDGENIGMQSLDSGDYVSAANNGSSRAAVYLKTAGDLRNSEQFRVDCADDHPRLIWRRVGYGYGHAFAGATFGAWATNEVIDGVFAGPNENTEDDLEFIRDTLDQFLFGSVDSAVDNPKGSRTLPRYDAETSAWAFGSDAVPGVWTLGSTYITYETGAIGNDSLFDVEVAEGW